MNRRTIFALSIAISGGVAALAAPIPAGAAVQLPGLSSQVTAPLQLVQDQGDEWRRREGGDDWRWRWRRERERDWRGERAWRGEGDWRWRHRRHREGEGDEGEPR